MLCLILVCLYQAVSHLQSISSLSGRIIVSDDDVVVLCELTLLELSLTK